MKRNFSRIISCCLAAGLITAAALSVISCSSGTTATTTESTSTGSFALASIGIVPSFQPNLNIGATAKFSALGIYLDGASHDITAQATWKSDNPSVVSVAADGTITAIAAGTANITAALSGVTSAAVPVTVAPLTTTTTTTTAATGTTTDTTTTTTTTAP